MAAFQNDSHYALELAYRSQLNMLILLQHKYIITGVTQKVEEIQREITTLQERMENQGYMQLPFCNGTQMINSLLGVLVIPKEEFFQQMWRYNKISDWTTNLPTLYHYICSRNPNVFHNEYSYYNRRYDRYEHERNTIQNVLRHMRNAICHDKLSVHPLSDEQNREVTHIIFRDFDEQHSTLQECTEEFYLKIEIEDLFVILSELVSFYERIAQDHPNQN